MEGANTPAFDSNGLVTGPDSTGTMINDMRSFLDFAQTKDILVIFALWNGAYLREQNTINLFWDEVKLQSYIDNALKVYILDSNHLLNLKPIKFMFFKAYGKRIGQSSCPWCLGNHQRTGGIPFQ